MRFLKEREKRFALPLPSLLHRCRSEPLRHLDSNGLDGREIAWVYAMIWVVGKSLT
jgi:hypothetical protein